MLAKEPPRPRIWAQIVFLPSSVLGHHPQRTPLHIHHNELSGVRSAGPSALSNLITSLAFTALVPSTKPPITLPLTGRASSGQYRAVWLSWVHVPAGASVVNHPNAALTDTRILGTADSSCPPSPAPAPNLPCLSLSLSLVCTRRNKSSRGTRPTTSSCSGHSHRHFFHPFLSHFP